VIDRRFHPAQGAGRAPRVDRGAGRAGR
jgi:hypothetical protein